MKLSILSAIAAAVFATAGLQPAMAADTIKVGSKNFTEQYILAEMYSALLENAGFKVERKINLGGTLIAHQALTTGEIDLYPEYTGTALASVVKGTMSTDAQKVYDEVKAFYAKEFKLTWLKPTGINNGYVIVVRNETAKANNMKTLSDLAKVSKTLVFGGGAEFPDRADGLPGLKRVYSAEFKEFKQFAKLGLRYDALSQKDIDVANGAATDWQIGAQGLTPLDDDKGLFPALLCCTGRPPAGAGCQSEACRDTGIARFASRQRHDARPERQGRSRPRGSQGRRQRLPEKARHAQVTIRQMAGSTWPQAENRRTRKAGSSRRPFAAIAVTGLAGRSLENGNAGNLDRLSERARCQGTGADQ